MHAWSDFVHLRVFLITVSLPIEPFVCGEDEGVHFFGFHWANTPHVPVSTSTSHYGPHLVNSLIVVVQNGKGECTLTKCNGRHMYIIGLQCMKYEQNVLEVGLE